MATKPAAKKPAAAAPAAPVPAQQQPGTSVAVAEEKSMILVGDQQDVSHLQTGKARGNENVGTEDLVIPRLEIVQSQSKCLIANTPEFIEGAKQGDLVNSVTRRIYGREVFVVNCHYAKQWLVWKSYDEGGGFFGAYPDPEAAQIRLEEVVAEGEKREFLEVIDTPQHLCMLIDPKSFGVEEIMLALPRTKAGVSREWNTMIRLTGQDRFARVYRMTTAQETNKKNQTYWNYVVSSVGSPNPTLFKKAEALFEQVSSGARKFTMDVSDYQATTGEAADSEM